MAVSPSWNEEAFQVVSVPLGTVLPELLAVDRIVERFPQPNVPPLAPLLALVEPTHK